MKTSSSVFGKALYPINLNHLLNLDYLFMNFFRNRYLVTQVSRANNTFDDINS